MELKRLREEFEQAEAEFDRIRRKRDGIWGTYEKRISSEIKNFAEFYLSDFNFKIVNLSVKFAIYTLKRIDNKIHLIGPDKVILTTIESNQDVLFGDSKLNYSTLKRVLDFIEWPLELIIRRKTILLLLAKWRQSDLRVFPKDLIILILQRVWRGN